MAVAAGTVAFASISYLAIEAPSNRLAASSRAVSPQAFTRDVVVQRFGNRFSHTAREGMWDIVCLVVPTAFSWVTGRSTNDF